MIEMVVAKLGAKEDSNSRCVILLKEKDGARYLPLWVTEPEVDAAYLAVCGIPAVRLNRRT